MTHTLQETAVALGMTIDEVRNTENRALRKLRSNPVLIKAAREMGLIKEDTCDTSEYSALQSSWPEAV